MTKIPTQKSHQILNFLLPNIQNTSVPEMLSSFFVSLIFPTPLYISSLPPLPEHLDFPICLSIQISSPFFLLIIKYLKNPSAIS